MKFLLTLVLLVCNIALAKDFDTTPQSIETLSTPEGYKLESFDKRYTFAIPRAYIVKRGEIENEFLMIISKGKIISSIIELEASDKSFFNAEDFGLKGNRGKVLATLYGKSITTNKAINKFREEMSKVSTNVQVFKRDNFIFYKQTKADEDEGEFVDLIITNLINDDIIIAGLVKGNEEFFMNFIKTFKSN
ncbi:MAG: hypothetical protein L3J59_02175 [Methylococcaceae bacterium]|nr:hypothetical protein [Methylococcaceae bacterium]